MTDDCRGNLLRLSQRKSRDGRSTQQSDGPVVGTCWTRPGWTGLRTETRCCVSDRPRLEGPAGGVEVDHHIHHTLAASSSQRGLFFARVTFSGDECPAGAWGEPLRSHPCGYGHQSEPFPLTNAGQIETLVRCELEHATADPSNPAFHPLSSSGRRHLSLQMFPKTCL